TIRHVTLPLKHGWFAARSEMHLTARWASNPGRPGCSPAQHTPELAAPVAFRRKYLVPVQTGWSPAPEAAWSGHPLQCPHENRLVERQFAEGAPAAPDPVAGRRAARPGGIAGNQARGREVSRRRTGRGRLPRGVFGPEDLQRRGDPGP